MPINFYLQDSRQILQAFESTQAKLIRLKIAEAVSEFSVEIWRMDTEFSRMHARLRQHPEAQDRLTSLNLLQLDRLQNFLKELQLQVRQLQDMRTPDHKLILFFLQRQYKFKQIFRRHLTDYARLSWQK